MEYHICTIIGLMGPGSRVTVRLPKHSTITEEQVDAVIEDSKKIRVKLVEKTRLGTKLALLA